MKEGARAEKQSVACSLSQPLLMAIPIRLHAQDERERQQLREERGEAGEVAKIDPSLRCEEKSKA